MHPDGLMRDSVAELDRRLGVAFRWAPPYWPDHQAQKFFSEPGEGLCARFSEKRGEVPQFAQQTFIEAADQCDLGRDTVTLADYSGSQVTKFSGASRPRGGI